MAEDVAWGVSPERRPITGETRLRPLLPEPLEKHMDSSASRVCCDKKRHRIVLCRRGGARELARDGRATHAVVYVTLTETMRAREAVFNMSTPVMDGREARGADSVASMAGKGSLCSSEGGGGGLCGPLLVGITEVSKSASLDSELAEH